MSLVFCPEIVLVVCGPICLCKLVDSGFRIFNSFNDFLGFVSRHKSSSTIVFGRDVDY